MKFLQELNEMIELSECEDCEVVFVNENDEILSESAKRAMKRQGGKIVKKYRCTSGPKTGMLVSDPKTCMTRKDPKRKRIGKKVMRQKGGVIRRKTAISKRSAQSKTLQRANKRLSGK